MTPENTAARAYVVRVKVDGAPDEVYESPQDAYSPMDAVQQAVFELDAEHGFSERGRKMKVLSVRPPRLLVVAPKP